MYRNKTVYFLRTVQRIYRLEVRNSQRGSLLSNSSAAELSNTNIPSLDINSTPPNNLAFVWLLEVDIHWKHLKVFNFVERSQVANSQDESVLFYALYLYLSLCVASITLKIFYEPFFKHSSSGKKEEVFSCVVGTFASETHK